MSVGIVSTRVNEIHLFFSHYQTTVKDMRDVGCLPHCVPRQRLSRPPSGPDSVLSGSSQQEEGGIKEQFSRHEMRSIIK